MTRKEKLLIGLMTLLLLLLWWLWPSLPKSGVSGEDSSPKQTSQEPGSETAEKDVNVSQKPFNSVDEREKKKQEAVDKIVSAYNTPITFYGKVIDQFGNPVSEAQASFGALDKFYSAGSEYTAYSDENGLFSISDIKGIGLTVGVSKEGYYPIHGKSNGSFAYGVGPDSHRQAPPTQNKPAVFVLQKMGETEPLVYISSRTYRIAKNGAPVGIDLKTGLLSSKGDIRIEAWTNDQSKDVEKHYNWKCLISVPNGGLIERTDQFAFEAPTEGYRTADEIVMPQNAERWQPQQERQYFVKLNNGRYARIQFRMIAGGDHFFRLESYLNPESGHRNLEFDPEKAIIP